MSESDSECNSSSSSSSNNSGSSSDSSGIATLDSTNVGNKDQATEDVGGTNKKPEIDTEDSNTIIKPENTTEEVADTDNKPDTAIEEVGYTSNKPATATEDDVDTNNKLETTTEEVANSAKEQVIVTEIEAIKPALDEIDDPKVEKVKDNKEQNAAKEKEVVKQAEQSDDSTKLAMMTNEEEKVIDSVNEDNVLKEDVQENIKDKSENTKVVQQNDKTLEDGETVSDHEEQLPKIVKTNEKVRVASEIVAKAVANKEVRGRSPIKSNRRHRSRSRSRSIDKNNKRPRSRSHHRSRSGSRSKQSRRHRRSHSRSRTRRRSKSTSLERRREERKRRHAQRDAQDTKKDESAKNSHRDGEKDRRSDDSPSTSANSKHNNTDNASVTVPKAQITERQRRTVDLLTSRTGGAYIPPAKLRMMQAEITDKASAAYQRIAWEALKKSIHGYINKVNVDNIAIITRELLKENVVRGRGLLCRSIIQAQAASPTFTHVYAALVSIINSKFPNIGELLLKRLAIQFKRAFRRNDKAICMSSTRFIAHLINQRVAHEVLALEILTLLVEQPTDDSVEVSIGFLKECGMKLTELSSKGIGAIFEMLKNILHEGKLEKRVQYMIEVVFQVRKDGFKDHQSVIESLELVEEDDQFTHMMMLDDAVNTEDTLNAFKFDEQYEVNEERYKGLSKEILGSDASGSNASSSGSGSGSKSDGSSDSDDEGDDKDGERTTAGDIIDNTETNLIALRRTIYLTINSSLDYEECAHKLMKMQLKPGQEAELCHMFLDCCAEQRTYEKFYGLLAQRFCAINKIYIEPFEEIFRDTYQTTHRLDTNRLRNVSKFFAHLLFTDAIGWDVLDCIKLNEDDTTSSSRIFIKILFQELAEYMGLSKLNGKLKDQALVESLTGLFPKDNPRNTRFSINFFTSIGLGGLTDELRQFLKNAPKSVPAINAELLNAKPITVETDSSSSSSSSYSSSSSSDSSSSGSDSSSSSSTSSDSDSESSDSENEQKRKKKSKTTKKTKTKSITSKSSKNKQSKPKSKSKNKHKRKQQSESSSSSSSDTEDSDSDSSSSSSDENSSGNEKNKRKKSKQTKSQTQNNKRARRESIETNEKQNKSKKKGHADVNSRPRNNEKTDSDDDKRSQRKQPKAHNGNGHSKHVKQHHDNNERNKRNNVNADDERNKRKRQNSDEGYKQNKNDQHNSRQKERRVGNNEEPKYNGKHREHSAERVMKRDYKKNSDKRSDECIDRTNRSRDYDRRDQTERSRDRNQRDYHDKERNNERNREQNGRYDRSDRDGRSDRKNRSCSRDLTANKRKNDMKNEHSKYKRNSSKERG